MIRQISLKGVIIARIGNTVRKAEAWLVLLSGWHRHIVAFFAGAISALSMAPFDAFFVLFFTFPILVWLIDGVSNEPETGLRSKFWEGFKPGFWFGFGYFLCGLWWIGSAFLVDAEEFLWAMPIAILALPALLAVFWGVATAIARLFWSGDVSRIFALAAAFMLLEYIRGIFATGLPWNAIAYAAYFNPIMMQSASVLGLYSMTPFVILVGALLVFIFPGSGARTFKHKLMIGLCFGLMLCHVSFGVLRFETSRSDMVEGVNLRLMQPNINQAEKFQPGKDKQILQTYLDLSVTENEGTKLSDVTHLIWPESAFPFLLTDRRDALAAISSMLPSGTNLITGAARAEQAGGSGKEDLVFNSVYVVDSEGVIVSAADKVHLVPFGEYLPLQSLAEGFGIKQLTQVQGGFTAGNSRKLLSTGVGPQFLPLICYEIIFSGQLWGESKRPGWILNLTNDGWFGMTPGPYQHERQAIVRAVEEGLPLVRVANTGISGVYDVYGRTISRLELGEKGVLDSPLPQALPQTIFTIFGDATFW